MRKIAVILVLILLIAISGCSRNETIPIEGLRDIKPLDLDRTTLTSLRKYNPYSSELMQIDLRGYDLTRLKINDNYEELIHADFDTATKWPYWLPDGFNPKRILEAGKNPGLGIRSLHKDGITGKGVAVAVIDDVLLPGHEEYRHALKFYEEISLTGDEAASVTGCRQASLIVGKTTGVAPEADLYYIAVPNDLEKKKSGLSTPYETRLTYDPLAVAVNRIVELNEKLEEDHRIRVLCIGYDISDNDKAHGQLENAIEKAKRAGIFVVSTCLYETYDYQMDFNGLGRDPMADPDQVDSYKPGHIWEYSLYTFGRYTRALEGLLVPMDARTAAAPTGEDQYAYYAQNDKTMCIPYIGGLYALACQVNPDVTPEDFWEKALETGDKITFQRDGVTYALKMIVNPLALMEAIRN